MNLIVKIYSNMLNHAFCFNIMPMRNKDKSMQNRKIPPSLTKKTKTYF